MSAGGHRGRRRFRCENCVRLKVKCSEQLPCATCFKLCLPCEPPPSEKGKSYAQLALASIEASHLNELYLASFKRQYAQSNIDVNLYKQQLRLWEHTSRLAQTDLSQGLVKDLCGVLGIEVTEVDVKRKDASDVVEDDYLKDLQSQIADSQSFKILDSSDWVLRVVMFVDHREVVVWNVLGVQAIMTNEELRTYVDTYKMLDIHILASLFNPEDRAYYYDTLVAQFRATAEPNVVMAKFCNRDGSITLYILRTRRMVFPEFPGRPVFVLTFEPVPESRYVTNSPFLKHHVVKRFQQRQKQKGSFAASTSCGIAPPPLLPLQDTGPPFVVPGIATVPGNTINDEQLAQYLQIDLDDEAAQLFGRGGMNVNDDLHEQVGEGRSTRKDGRYRDLEAGKGKERGPQTQQQHHRRQQQRLRQGRRQGADRLSPRQQQHQLGVGYDTQSDDIAGPSRTFSSPLAAAAQELQAFASLPDLQSDELCDDELVESLSDPNLLRELEEVEDGS